MSPRDENPSARANLGAHYGAVRRRITAARPRRKSADNSGDPLSAYADKDQLYDLAGLGLARGNAFTGQPAIGRCVHDPVAAYAGKDQLYDIAGVGLPRANPFAGAEVVLRTVDGLIPLPALRRAVCAAHTVRRNEFESGCRRIDLVAARFEFYWLASRYTKHSPAIVARVAGGRDRTTVIHGCKKFAAMLARGEVKPRVRIIGGPP